MKKLAWTMALAALALPLFAREAPAEEEALAAVEEFLAGLDFQTGLIEVADGVASLNVPETFRFLGPEDAQSVLEDLWGNPPDDTVLGMLFPAGVSPDEMEAWGVIVTYEEDGYVDDGDAAEIDYAELLEQMQSDTEASNEFRRENGYEEVALVGWAAEPRYASEEKKLYWAKNLRFGNAEENTLNYDVRVLGRKGVLVMRAVASINQLGDIRTGMDDVMAFVDFNEGYRYSDFNPDIDEVAAYGIGALIAGKVAAKVGLLKGLTLFLAKFWKIIALAAVGLLGFLKKMFTGKLGEDDPREVS